jgi:hypothetical protein
MENIERVDGEYKCAIIVDKVTRVVTFYRWKGGGDVERTTVEHKGQTVAIEGAGVTATIPFRNYDTTVGS